MWVGNGRTLLGLRLRPRSDAERHQEPLGAAGLVSPQRLHRTGGGQYRPRSGEDLTAASVISDDGRCQSLLSP